MKIIFLGAPGAGKGTQAENASLRYNIPSLSTGVILREAIKNETEMGLAAKGFVESGKLVPDEIVIGIIKDRLEENDCLNGFILDGFPRTVPQAEALEAMGVNIDVVVSIEVPDETIVERMSGRRACAKCGSTYHLEFNPSSDIIHCDKCGETLTTRHDDLPEVVLERLETYHAKTAPLINFYEGLGKLKTVVGQIEVAETTKLTFEVLDKTADEIKRQ